MNVLRVRQALLLVLCWGCAYCPPASAQSLASTTSAMLEERLARLEQTLRAVESRLDDLEKRAADGSVPAAFSESLRQTAVVVAALQQQVSSIPAAPLRAPAQAPATSAAARSDTTQAGPSGFWVQSADGAFKIKPRFSLNADGRFATEGPQLASFSLRRAQAILEASVFRHFDLKFQADFGKGQGALNDAYLDWGLSDWVKIRAGKFKTPLGLERLMSGPNLPLMERSLVSQLIPNRDEGIMLHGEPGNSRLEYSAAILNGIPDAASADVDADQHKDFVGRLFVHPFAFSAAKPPFDFGIGLGASAGSRSGSPANSALPAYQTTAGLTFFHYRSDGAAGTVVADGRQWRVAPQATLYWDSLGLLGEYALSSMHVRRGARRAVLDNTGWQVTASYILTGEKASVNGVTPARPFDPRLGQWGAFEVVGRFGTLRAAPAAFPLFAAPEMAQKANAWAFGLNWYLNTILKMAVNYEQTHFSYGQPVSSPEYERVFMERFQLRF